MKKLFNTLLLLSFLALLSSWGFYSHKKINRLAVFILPLEMIGFYKENISYITDKAVNPDMRRYIIKEEACRHYIDLDEYGDSALFHLPRYYGQALEEVGEDTMMAYGMVPWHIARVQSWLTKAFLNQDKDAVLRLSADLGHYIADANVPLHTTSNYNGQQTGQVGIHGFWESRLPELFADDYDFFVGQASYVPNVQLRAWDAVRGSHMALDSVLNFERELTRKFPDSKKYSFEERGASTLRVYSYDFSREYHDMLQGMVERQMRNAIKMVGDFWYTAWVDGGQPNINTWGLNMTGEEEEGAFEPVPSQRNHESGELAP